MGTFGDDHGSQAGIPWTLHNVDQPRTRPATGGGGGGKSGCCFKALGHPSPHIGRRLALRLAIRWIKAGGRPRPLWA